MVRELSGQFPEISERREYILQVTEAEERKYSEALERGVRLLERMVAEMPEDRREITEEQLLVLYDSHGLPPEIVREVAARAGVRVEVPEDFYIRVAKSHSRVRHVPAQTSPVDERELKGLRPTRLLFYERPKLMEFEARVLKTIGDYVVLDRTAFYPEGGGQPSDIGEIVAGEARAAVKEVLKAGDIVLHRVEPAIFRRGQRVTGRVDWERRRSLMAHHTATHILLGALKKVLGPHVWQQGAQKGVERSRLDVSHFRRISREEMEEVERLCNKVIFENRRVLTRWMDRNEAEGRYGFELYQGGVVPGRKLRVVEVEGWNVQACAGTHCESTGEVGLLKITGVERIQDGIERIEFAAGGAALKVIREREAGLARISEMLGVQEEKLPEAVKRMVEEMKDLRRKVERMEARVGEMLADLMRSRSVRMGELKVISTRIDEIGSGELIKACERIVGEDENAVVVVGGASEGSARIMMMAGRKAVEKGVDCGRIILKVSRMIGGGGGGRPNFAQGGGTRVEGLDDAIRAAVEEISRPGEG